MGSHGGMEPHSTTFHGLVIPPGHEVSPHPRPEGDIPQPPGFFARCASDSTMDTRLGSARNSIIAENRIAPPAPGLTLTELGCRCKQNAPCPQMSSPRLVVRTHLGSQSHEADYSG